MANSLNKDLTNKTVVISGKYLCERLKNASERERAFVVKSGFGASPSTMGSALLGEWLADGEKDRVEGHMVEKLYEEEETTK
jgi:hypothetical protein